MTTITIEATDHAREYVKGLYMTRKSIVETAEAIAEVCRDMLGSPDIRAVDGRAKAALRAAESDIEVIDWAANALGFEVDESGEIWRCTAAVSFQRICFHAATAEHWPEDSAAVFRAVLSAFGITYTVGDHCAIRYTYTPEER